MDSKFKWLYERAKQATGETRLTWLILAKGYCHEMGWASLYCDMIGEIGLTKDAINRGIKQENRKRKKDGLPALPLLPIRTFAAANMTDEEILNYAMGA